MGPKFIVWRTLAFLTLGAMIFNSGAVMSRTRSNTNQPVTSSQAAKFAASANVAATPTLPADIGFPNTGTDLTIGLYDTLELVFTASTTPSNPFDTYLLKLEITDPNGNKFTIDGFYDGDGNGGQSGKVWKARITPYQAGNWSWRTVQGDASDTALQNLSGSFTCSSNGNTGGVVKDGKAFKFQNGKYVYLVGNFLDFANGLRTTHTYMGEATTDGQRDSIINRQKDFHTANKTNLYFANKGDYDNQSVTPWVGSASSNDKSKMDLARWKKYDGYIQRQLQNGMLAEMWFFADDSNFGALSTTDKNRLGRYAMARTSAFSHTMYVIALEWQEGWTATKVRDFGNYLNARNPWNRAISVHMLTGSTWNFSGEGWADFIASQPGNDASPSSVNAYGRDFYSSQSIPHIGEEFGLLYADSNADLRKRLWANFASGAAGSGTGSDLKALVRFLEQSKIPFQRMAPANNLLSGSGANRYARAETSHHYFVYSEGGTFTLQVSGSNLKGRWFDPRNPNANLGAEFSVTAGSRTFTPPSSTSSDWVLWITDSSNLNSGEIHPSPGAAIVSVTVSGGSTPPPTATTPPPTATTPPPTATTPPPTNTPPPPPTQGIIVYVSPEKDGSVGGVSYADEDILAFDISTGKWSLFFDGSDVGIGAGNLVAFELMNDGTLLIAMKAAIQLSGVGWIEAKDIVKFTPVSLGSNTAGTFSWFLDGSDVDLVENSENIDAIAFAPDGRLLISTVGAANVAGISAHDEDLLAFEGSNWGQDTGGTWSLYFDGTKVGLNNTSDEDVDSAWVNPEDGKIYLGTLGAFQVNDVSGDGADIFACMPGGYGDNTTCNFDAQLLLNCQHHGALKLIDAISVLPANQAILPAPMLGDYQLFLAVTLR